MTLILRKPGDLDHGIVLVLERSSPTGGAGWFPSNLSCPQTRIIYPPIESTRMRKLKELRLYRDCCAGAAARPLATRFAARCMNDCSFTIVALAMLYRRPSALRPPRRSRTESLRETCSRSRMVDVCHCTIPERPLWPTILQWGCVPRLSTDGHDFCHFAGCQRLHEPLRFAPSA